MWISRGNLRSFVKKATPEENAWLRDYLTFEGPKRGRNLPPERTCMYDLSNNTYPAGFDTLIKSAAEDADHEVHFIDKRTPPVAVDATADLDWLRDYQRKAIDAAIKHTRGMLWLPTGAGKTEIIVGITRALPCRWLALVHRSQLADDIATRFEKRSPGLFAGRILEGRWDVPDDASLICATYQSLAAGLKKSPHDPANQRVKHLLREWAQGIMPDEAHTVPANSFYRLVMQTKNAYYRIGLSGTPLARGDKKSMFAIGALGRVVYRIRPQLLIDRGVLAKPTVRLLTVTQDSNAKTWAGVRGDCVVRGKARNAMLVTAAKRAAKPAFLFVEEVDHGKALEKLLLTAGVSCTFVWGSHSLDYRKSLIKRLVLGHFEVLICSKIFNEGIDVPELRAVIVGAGGKSVISTFQRLGRGMRVDRDAEGKVREGGGEFEVWDLLDRGHRWMERHANLRQASYASEGYQTFVEPEPEPGRPLPGMQKLRERLTAKRQLGLPGVT